jgi:hypothetical protein
MKRTCGAFLAMLLSVMLVVPLNSQTVNAETPKGSWIKTCGGTNRDGALALVQTSDGGYAFAGWTLSFGAGNVDFWLVRADASGVVPEFPIPTGAWTVDWEALLILAAGLAVISFVVILVKRKFRGSPRKPH